MDAMISNNGTGDTLIMINVFAVAPDKQQELVDTLIRASETVMNRLPGFVSATIHKSLDGTRVTNVARWADKQSFDAMQENPEARRHMQAAMQLANFDAHLYHEVSTAQAA
jgi:heme-degrading monooxygenase HmoA